MPSEPALSSAKVNIGQYPAHGEHRKLHWCHCFRRLSVVIAVMAQFTLIQSFCVDSWCPVSNGICQKQSVFNTNETSNQQLAHLTEQHFYASLFPDRSAKNIGRFEAAQSELGLIMTPVEEYSSKCNTDKAGIPTMALFTEQNQAVKALQPNRDLLKKNKNLAAEAARAWAEKSGISWNDFTQSTTFHGIRYIFDSSPRAYKSRK